MKHAELAELGDTLLQAYASGDAIAPLTEAHPALSIDDAYRVQMHQVAAWTSAGRIVAGYKVGLTSRAMRSQLGVDQPDFGHIFSDMILSGREIDASAFLSPKAEPEIAFVLRDELVGPGLSLADVIGAVDYAVAAIEIIDSRIANWRITIGDTIADNASSGALVLGTTALVIDEVALGQLGCIVTKNGEVVATGAGAAVLGNPLEGVLWLANTLGERGQSLEAGSIILAGSLTAAVDVTAGDTVTARFARLGSVSARFTPQQQKEGNK